MNFAEKKLETIANLAIIVVAIVLLGVMIQRYWGTSEDLPKDEIKVGTTFGLTGVNWAENKQTLVLVLQENCRFCNESSPFYKKLVEKNQTSKTTKLVAVFSSPIEKAKAHLKEQGVEIAVVRQANSGMLGINGTPTLVLVDEQGKVVDSWVGKLLPAEEEQVLQKI